MQKERACTSACVMSNRFIYVLPGSHSNSWNTIERLEVTDLSKLSRLQWKLYNITNSDFICSYAFGSTQISAKELLVFGGSKQKSFIIDTDDSAFKAVTMKGGELCKEAWFGYESDYVGRIFGNYLYAIDAHLGLLHVYSIKEKKWNYSSLKELGVNL